jgi:hypothetical protein
MNEAHIYLASDSPSFTPILPRIREIGPRDLHLWKGRGPAAATEDAQDRHQQQQPLGIAHPTTLTPFWQSLQKGNQISTR